LTKCKLTLCVNAL